MRNIAASSYLPTLLLSALTLAGSSCVPADSNSNTSTNVNSTSSSGTNSNSNSALSSNSSSEAIDVREPDAYKAKLSLSLESVGSQQTLSLPTVSAEVSKSGTDNRLAINLPGGNTVIYL